MVTTCISPWTTTASVLVSAPAKGLKRLGSGKIRHDEAAALAERQRNGVAHKSARIKGAVNAPAMPAAGVRGHP